MSTNIKSLIFFDKEGYPYNFNYNENNKEWEGKIYFDENSSDTFKTICMYIFENVQPYNFKETFDLRSSQLFNYSGITFLPQSISTEEKITNIQKVNNNPNFYSKWVYGDKFDKKFPVGSTICFNNLTGYTNSYQTSSPFSLIGTSGNTYYNVVGSKKDAFLITTYTNNRDFNFIFSGGTVSSVNVIKTPDYGDQKLVDLNNLNYYPDKKISVYGSNNNDGVYTYRDYNVLKTKIYDFLLPDMSYETGFTLKLDFYLMTQRPKLYEGDVIINYNDNSVTGTTIEFVNYINTSIDFVETGQTIIFENIDASPINSSDPEFKITGFIDRETILTDNLNFYYNQEISVIQTTSAITYTGLTYNDYIEIIATPYITGKTLHDKRQFQILNIENNKIQVREYIIPETGYTYKVSKVINKKKIKKIYCQQNSILETSSFYGYVICCSTTNKISLSQSIIPSGTTTYFYENTISSMRNKYINILNRYGLNLYHYHYNGYNYMVLDGLDYNYQPYYSGATAHINSNPLYLSNNFTYLNTGSTSQDSDIFYIITDEKLKSYEKVFHYDYNKLSKNFLIEIYFNINRDFVGYGFNITLNDLNYYIPISLNSTTSNNCIDIPTIHPTIINMTGDTSLSYSVGQEVNVIYDNEHRFSALILSYDYNSRNFILSSLDNIGDGTFCEWSISNTSNYTLNTINSFIEKYYNIFNLNGINIYSGYTNLNYTGYTLFIESFQPNIILYDIDVKVNNNSDFSIIQKVNNNSIVIDSSELYLVDNNKSLYDYELSTGMIIDICGCTYNTNNKQYNILRVTPDIIQLSYQGPFLYEYNRELFISINSYLRTPRGNYNRDINYKFSWNPIEENEPKISKNIFYYDYSGEQLKDNGLLTYQGQKPLWNNDTNNLVFLNDKPNYNIERIYDPEYQQTIFEELNYKLERLNSVQYYNYVPVPIQVFIGFNSKNEGVSQNELILEKIENIIFSGKTSNVSGDTIYINNFLITTGDTESYIDYIVNSYIGEYEYIEDNVSEKIKTRFDFSLLGFEEGQFISINFSEDIVTGQTLFNNYEIYEIKDITNNRITINGLLTSFDTSLSGKTYNFIIKTEPHRIANISIYGQTEIEDERFVQHLKLLGAKLNSETQPIFKESDINEIGIDYTILNRKRKELLTIYPEIYNYIGSYKALINSINFFGYNDLDLYEYYRCIKPKSPLYGKLQRVLIEDIFVNTIPGWEEIEIDSSNYLKTNLFNLTYKITDFDGNYVEMYSLSEVQQKLIKMVQWLRKNIIPLSSNILDITGVANAGTSFYSNYNAANYVKKILVNQNNSVINFYYIQTLNIDTNYLFTINFYLVSGSTMPDYWTAKIKTFHLNENTRELEPVQYINLYKRDLLSYSFNIDYNIDPYVYIETQSYNEYGLGYTNHKLFNYNEGRNFVLINNNFTNINYKYVNNEYGYYIIDNGRFYIINF